MEVIDWVVDSKDVPAAPLVCGIDRPYARRLMALNGPGATRTPKEGQSWASANSARMVRVTRVDKAGKPIGEPFPSATEAGQSIGRTMHAICNAISRHTRAGGWYWRRMSELKQAWKPKEQRSVIQ